MSDSAGVPREGVGSPNALRRANEQRIVDVLRLSGASSQAHLARESGLSRATVNNVVKSLGSRSLVFVESGANRRETTVSLAKFTGVVIAIDLGHLWVHGTVVSFSDETRRDLVLQVEREGSTDIDADTVSALVADLLLQEGIESSDLIAVCLGIHAPFDNSAGEISPSAVLPAWGGVNVAAVLEERLGVPVFVDNDANFAALAEWTWGSGQRSNDFLYVRSSKGIGAGLILNGRVYHGGTGMAGELGHIVVEERGQLCNCGNRGCLSAVASGRALLNQLRQAGNELYSLRAIIDAANGGDASCARVIQEAGRYTGLALSHAVKIVAPSRIAIGGELAGAGDLFFDEVRTVLEANTLRTATTPIVVSKGVLTEDMCLLGCIAHVLEHEGRGLAEIPDWLVKPIAAQPSADRNYRGKVEVF
jgi:predicted NBD/HSP70 family sugar kinase